MQALGPVLVAAVRPHPLQHSEVAALRRRIARVAIRPVLAVSPHPLQHFKVYVHFLALQILQMGSNDAPRNYLHYAVKTDYKNNIFDKYMNILN